MIHSMKSSASFSLVLGASLIAPLLASSTSPSHLAHAADNLRRVNTSGTYIIGGYLMKSLSQSKSPLIEKTPEGKVVLKSGVESISCSKINERAVCTVTMNLDLPGEDPARKAFSQALFDAMDTMAATEAMSDGNIHRKTFPKAKMDSVEFTDFGSSTIECTRSELFGREYLHLCRLDIHEKLDTERVSQLYLEALKDPSYKDILESMLERFKVEGLVQTDRYNTGLEGLEGTIELSVGFHYPTGKPAPISPPYDGRVIRIKGRIDGGRIEEVHSVAVEHLALLRPPGAGL